MNHVYKLTLMFTNFTNLPGGNNDAVVKEKTEVGASKK